MKGITDMTKKHLYRGVSGVLAAAMLLSGNSLIRNVQGEEIPGREIAVHYQEGDGLTQIRVDAAWLEFEQQEAELYLLALEEEAELRDEAARLAAEQAAKEQQEAMKDALNQSGSGNALDIGGTSSGKGDGGGRKPMEDNSRPAYGSDAVTLFGEPAYSGSGTMSRGPIEAYWEAYEERYEEFEEYVEGFWEVSLFGSYTPAIATSYDERLYSLQLADYDPDVHGENIGDILIDNLYEPAFAGWKLTEINGDAVEGEWFYPDHDYVYFNDEPFCDPQYGDNGSEIESLTFEPLWGKTVYVRDPYNFVDLGNVYGENGAVAKIDWDTRKTYSYDPVEENGELVFEQRGSRIYNGATEDTPVSTLEAACKVMGENGGKIVVVNHLTLEASAAGSYPYQQGFTNKGVTDRKEIGKGINHGVLTITGEGQGSFEGEGKEADQERYYEDASIYVKNTCGFGLYQDPSTGKETMYGATIIYTDLTANTVLEHLNYVGYRESYDSTNSRYNATHRIRMCYDRRYVFEETFRLYKRNTNASSSKNDKTAKQGRDSSNWLHCIVENAQYNDFAGLTANGSSWTELHISRASPTKAGNHQYLTVYGAYGITNSQHDGNANGFYHVYGGEVSGDTKLGNTHINLQGIITNEVSPNSRSIAFQADFIGLRLDGVKATVVSPYQTSSPVGENNRIEEFVVVCDNTLGTTSPAITDFYIGGYSKNQTGEEARFSIGDGQASFYMDGGKITNLFGGGSQIGNRLYGDLNFYINGGNITSLYGGGKGGFIGTVGSGSSRTRRSAEKNEIRITMNGGTVGSLYGGGKGGAAKLYSGGAPVNLIKKNAEVDDADKPLYVAYDGETKISAGASNTYPTIPCALQNYTVDGVVYQTMKYAYLYAASTTSKLSDYYAPYGEYTASDATVWANVHVEINGGTVQGNVYGGGENGAVAGDMNVTVNGGTIGGSVFGGGKGVDEHYGIETTAGKFCVVFTANDTIGCTVEEFQQLAAKAGTVYSNGLSDPRFGAGLQRALPFLIGNEMEAEGLLHEYTYVDEKGKTVTTNALYIYTDTIKKFGQIQGDTTVVINGGTIKGDVFGGSDGAVANIDGNTSVSIHTNFANRVFGGGNEGEVSGSTQVNVASDVTVGGVIYGGGNKAVVRGNTDVTVSGSAAETVFAGGNEGVVGGNTALSVTGTALQGIYGGGNLADVAGAATVSVSGTVEGDVYGGGNQAGVGTTTGVTVSGTVTGSVFGGNNLQGEIGTSASVTLDGGTVDGDLYGGGNQAGNAFDTTVTIASGTLTGDVYGGGLGNAASVADTTVTIGTGMAGNVFGGGNEGVVTGSTAVTVEENAVVGGVLYGGGNLAAVNSNTRVTVSGTVKKEIYGGGNEGKVGGTTAVVLYGTAGDPADPSSGSLYGGGNKAGVDGTGAAADAATTDVTVYGTVHGAVYGGNNVSGEVGGSARVNVDGGSVSGDVYGGGNQAGNREQQAFDTAVTVNGAVNGSVYGGGLGENATVGSTDVTILAGTVKQDVYGGGNAGTATGTTQVTLEEDAEILQDVYGGGNQAGVAGGDADEHTTAVTVSGTVGGSVFGGNNVLGEIGASTSVTLDGGTVAGNLYGGGNQAGNAPGTPQFRTFVTVSDGTVGCDAENTGSVYGGGLGATAEVGDATTEVTGGRITGNLFGGGYAGHTANTSVTVTGGQLGKTVDGEPVNGSIYGGGYEGDTADTTVFVDSTEISGEIYGGGLNGEAEDTCVTIQNTQEYPDMVYSNVYGGGYGATATSESTNVIIDGALEIAKVFGGGNAGACGVTAVTVSRGEIGSVYGGGYEAQAGSTSVVLDGDLSTAIIGYVYGGGEKGHVSGGLGNTEVLLKGALVEHSLYGGGYEGDVSGNASVVVNKGAVGGNLYGGGYAGTVGSTSVVLQDFRQPGLLDGPAAGGIVTVNGSVFGGGEGLDAYVYESTDVTVDLFYAFTATDTLVDLNDQYTSGEVRTVIEEKPGEYSRIYGSVYGGGDLGRVGQGRINQGNNTASDLTAATTSVTVKNGAIGNPGDADSGHVFGGGNGIPAQGTNYNVNMGTVFGSTETRIWGGYMLGNVYGGGKQSRLYAPDGAMAATVEIDQNRTADGGSGMIAIGGSVFGGGDRGSGANVNASVPTTVGNVQVDITGDDTTTIYFLEGGVYGDGNLCLVKGTRVINMTDFTTDVQDGGKQLLKTFYSLQRADEVHLTNTDIVLLGAIDLVDETDRTIYSINRVNALHLKQGSTIKLDQIVKYVGALTSDVAQDRKFIDGGNNGSNDFRYYSGNPDELSEDEITEYHAGTFVATAQKNTVCVANGLYLEIVKADDTYGPINGLFTLQLLRAVPGEGGGFVYADIVNSTADFICETERTANYKYAGTVDEEIFRYGEHAGGYYKRIMGQGYVLAETYEENTLYYYIDEIDAGQKAYMNVVDNVGGVGTHDGFAYYYWYINGATINYNLELTAYIGDVSTETEKGNVLPEHDTKLNYVLCGLEVSEKLANAVVGEEAVYTLVQTGTGLQDQEIAIELRLDDAEKTSLGFLKYTTEGNWVIDNGERQIEGYHGIMSGEGLSYNTLASFKVGKHSGSALDSSIYAHRLMFVLHKSEKVRAETTGMNIKIYIDLFDQATNSPFTDGASMLTFHTALNISRIRPIQNSYHAAERLYGGVSVSQPVQITRNSAMSAEYKTAYLPGAYPVGGQTTMRWVLSTDGYTFYEDGRGNYLTLGPNGYVNSSLNTTTLGQQYPADSGQYGYVFGEDGAYYHVVQKEDQNGEMVVNFTVKDATVQAAFPQGTKITVLDLTDAAAPGYYYYICTAAQTEIDLMDFTVMGTQTTIGEIPADSELQPAFMKACDGASLKQVEERLLFVVDYAYAQIADQDWSASNVFNSSFLLQHRYGDNTAADSEHDAEGNSLWEDIMDYVEVTEIIDKTTYERKMPSSITGELHEKHIGMENTVLSIQGQGAPGAVFRDFDSVPLQISLKESDQWFNTLFAEGEFSVTVELLEPKEGGSVTIGGTAYERVEKLPEGAAVIYKGVRYGANGDKSCIIIPVKNTGEHTLSYHNGLYSLGETVNGQQAAFRVKIYSSPDAQYFNAIDTQLIDCVAYTFEEAEQYVLAVSLDSQVLRAGGQLGITLKTKTTDAAQRVEMTVLRKQDGAYTACDWVDVFGEQSRQITPAADGMGAHALVLGNVPAGTYRLAFRYGDKTEYVNFIVTEAAGQTTGTTAGQ